MELNVSYEKNLLLITPIKWYADLVFYELP
mgnify:CR=1 FL=1